ncbi:SDR family oxidoreductase [Catalinimonas niigatensis]|uniref:SDR family oxidoreductase n=1 Tax=Catalinimonas niigatensis TaxID=1397264 RepID=UPI0026651127|nr:SDR family oxidoreductase [Catalinimonas niigatensis]WPP52297.1 SDR family oxidoreductase [Catalinimonas niigatensis]
MMKEKDQSISILGCGWLGLPLAVHLIGQGYPVKGSTTSPNKLPLLSKQGINSYLISLNPKINEDYQQEFFNSHTLILNIPPSRRQPDVEQFYPAQIQEVLKAAGNTALKNIIFVSSTSVYPSLNREVKEEDAGGELSASGKALLKVEQMLLDQQRFQVSILRFCGLYDKERNPGRFLAGRKLDSSGKDVVNLIHLDDCIGIISMLLKKPAWGEIYNACSDVHPEKESFYALATQNLGLEAPEFSDSAESSYKSVDSTKLKQYLEYRFLHPDPLRSLKES